MNTLENMVSLVERLAGKIEVITDERGYMLSEINRLRKRLMQRDEEAVKAVQEMRAELETAQADALRFQQERDRMNVKLQNLNGRLGSLAKAAGAENVSEAEKTLG